MKKVLIFLLLPLLLITCGKEVSLEEFNSDPSLFGEYISDYTSGLISKKSDIYVVLAFENTDWKPQEELSSSLFDITPSTDGKVVALSTNSIAFIPEKDLEQDTEYRITFHLSEVTEVPSELSKFNFSFKTFKQDFVVETRDLQSYSKDWQYLNGILTTSDDMDFEEAQQLISASQGDRNVRVKLDKQMSSTREFPFVIDSIKREVKDSYLTIKWDGTELGLDQKGEQRFEIPGKENFKIIQMEVIDEGEQMLHINFSDPIRKGQNLKGLIQVETASNLRFKTEGNILKVLFNDILDGELLVEVFQGIQSEEGYKMKKNHSEKVSFSQLKPNIRFTRNGSILPGSAAMKVNFEAVNLKKVDVKVYKIFTNNILQFLQENELNGTRNLRRVAAPVAEKTIELAEKNSRAAKRWTNYAIDLSTFIQPDPGAIYRVEIGFKRSYSLYSCDIAYNGEDEETSEHNPYDVRSVDEYDYYDYYWYDNYEYLNKKDPCEASYYRRSPIGMNILASDLGVIAKRGENGSYFFAVNNIISSESVSGAKIELFTYQQQLITTLTTDSEGFASGKANKYAYFAVVKKDKSTTYLKLDEGYANSVSNFNVSGKKLQKGLKGYVYGERGVWRPGDTLFIGFMLNDTENPIGKNHPIKFKLRDPNGKIVYQEVQNSTKEHHYTFVIPTDENATTGNWESVVSVGGAHFYKRIKIETIKPNRLKINNRLDSDVISARTTNKGTVHVNWLHGAIAKNLKLDMSAKFSAQTTKFKNYDNFIFDDPVRSFETEEVSLYSGSLNDLGVASYSIRPQVENEAPGMLKAVVMTKAYENGGDFSTDVMTVDYSPYSTYVGLQTPEPNKYGLLETGKKNQFTVVTVDEKGRPKAVNDLQVKIWKISWRWWWDASYENLSHYTSSYGRTPVENYHISTNSSGKASFSFKAEDDDWGRYLVRVYDPSGGHAAGTTVLIDWPYWSGKSKNDGSDNATMLVFNTDKEKYDVGEKAAISFPSSQGGRALVSLENGSKVVQTFWVSTQKGETKFELPVTQEMAPNVFVHITSLQPHSTTKNDAPIRMYGVVPIEVVDRSTVLEPQIKMPDVLQPEENFTVEVNEKNGKPMTYTLAVVDEGLLDLTRFKTPDAWKEFYAREALGVRTWDMYNEVIGAFGGKIEQIFSIGGDEDLSGAKAKKANRFKPVVMYYGPFTLQPGKSKKHTIKMPYYIGSVRTMVVAGNLENESYGSAEKATPVRKPLMVLASLPRKLSPTEKIKLPITVFAMESKVKNVSIQIKTNNAIRVIGSDKQTLTFSSPDEKMAYFDLEVNPVEGIGKVQVLATSGSEKAYYEVELDIFNPNPVTFETYDAVINASGSENIDFSTFGVPGTNEAWLEVSSFPAIDLSRRLDYLIRYPHGCLEQTTSTVFPQLYLEEITELTSSEKFKIKNNILNGIRKLSSFQLSNGGFAYWQGQQQADEWATSYVGHFLLEAEKKGYVLPVNLKSSWIAYQQKAAREWRFSTIYGNDFEQAYRLFTLALAGKPDLASMNRLKSTTGLSSVSRLRLAATYALAGQKNAAQQLVKSSQLEDLKTRGYSYYGSIDRNRAMLLETLVLTGDQYQAKKQAEKLAQQLSSDKWMSTQTTAYALYAIARFASISGESGVKGSVSVNGKTTSFQSSKSLVREKIDIKTGSNTVKVKNSGGNTLYTRVLSSGRLPVGEEKSFSNNLSLQVVYRTKSGSPVTLGQISQGSEIEAEIQIQNTSSERIENVALTHIIPSGFEIINMRYTDYGSSGNSKADHIDIRDDRSNFYFSLKGGERKVFTVRLNASYTGRYYLPGAQAEAMYNNDYRVRTTGEWVDISK